MTTTKKNNNVIDDDGFDEKAIISDNELAVADQWINDKKDHDGMAITEEQAEKAGFKSDGSWILVEVSRGSGKKENLVKMWVNPNPIIVVLNATQVLEAGSTEKAAPLLMCPKKLFSNSDDLAPSYRESTNYNQKKRDEAGEWQPWSPLFFFPVSKTGELLSRSPFVFKSNSESKNSLRNIALKKWVLAVAKDYTKRNAEKMQGKSPKTCLFFSAFAFKFLYRTEKLTSRTTGKSSDAVVAYDFEPFDSYKDILLPLKTREIVNEFVSEVPNYIKFFTDFKSSEKIEVDKETGEVTGFNEEELNKALDNGSQIDDIPF